MPGEPLYRIKISIYDDHTGEEVGFVDEPMMSQDAKIEQHRLDDNQPTYFRAMNHFRSERSEFEKTYYPKNEDDTEQLREAINL